MKASKTMWRIDNFADSPYHSRAALYPYNRVHGSLPSPPSLPPRARQHTTAQGKATQRPGEAPHSKKAR
ncbi:hypothetical protein E2C01_066389 [Portunus trituberculatus]|uniref:Uncharacterized protein n=1 Tax=Portunus trituberculatus TaxID=210409 RepID=A0A5B7HQ50_PORTR|nr:hypothetical protein [Portunus trituberculatus]